MGPPNLYDEGLQKFREDVKERIRDSKDQSLLEEFLRDKAAPEDAITSCKALGDQTGEKYGGVKVAGKEVIPTKWVNNVLSNIDSFVAVGNYAMKGAPESVGMAWFIIKLTLSAIQSNYELYSLFGSGLTDITEMMVIIKHYDRLYDERQKPGFSVSDVVDKLFKDVRATYAAVLNFGFSVKRHLAGGKLAKLRHGFKDFFGAEAGKFKAQVDAIAVLKAKVIEDSEAASQAKSFERFDDVQGAVESVQETVQQIRDFEKTSHAFQQAQVEWMQEILEGIRASMRPKTRWDWAKQDFEKNKQRLNPLTDTSEPVVEALRQKHAGTCEWVLNNDLYTRWYQASRSSLLYFTGETGAGKSVLLASLFEKISKESDSLQAVVQYVSCGMSGNGEAGESSSPQSLTRISNTIILQQYETAAADEGNPILLESCNKVFANPKLQKTSKIVTNKEDALPGLLDALSRLSSIQGKNAVILVDEVDRMNEQDQVQFFNSLKELLSSNAAPVGNQPHIHVLVSCRAGVPFDNLLFEKGSSIDVGTYNRGDIDLVLGAALDEMQGWSQGEKEEARKAILAKGGSRFKYVVQVAIPFLSQPFQRPLSNRLKELPEGMSETYDQAIRSMPPNYLELLRTALSWALFAPGPVHVPAIMQAYSRLWFMPVDNAASQVFTESSHDDYATALEIQQLRTASGPFLEISEPDDPGDYFVSLKDVMQVKNFCFHNTAGHLQPPNMESEVICEHCKANLADTARLSFVEKEGHLNMAITCLQHLNSPVFQRRYGLCAENDGHGTPGGPSQVLANGEVSQSGAGIEYHADSNAGSNRDENAPTRATKSPLGVLKSMVVENGQQNADFLPRKIEVENAKAGAAENRDSDDEEQVEDDTEDEDDEDDSDNEAEEDDKDDGGSDDGVKDKVGGESAPHDVRPEQDVDPDESVDDEDRKHAEPDGDDDDDDEDGSEDGKSTADDEMPVLRYEFVYWYHHVREAEALWTPAERQDNPLWMDLMAELNQFAENTAAFQKWQYSMSRWEDVEQDAPWKPLHVAALLGLTSWADQLIRSGASVFEKCDDTQPLQAAAYNGESHDMLKLLLDNGADPNAEEQDMIPALHGWVWENPRYADIELMLQHGADVTILDKANGWSVFHYLASSGDDPEVLRLLMNSGKSEQTPNINAKDADGKTPFHVLLTRRNVPLKLVKAFVAYGADVNAEDNSSSRPLQMAAQWGEVEVIRLIMPKISDINDPDKNGRTAIHEAAWAGYRPCVELLIENGADLNCLDHHTRNPLFFACLGDPSARTGDSRDTAKYLLESLHHIPVSAVNCTTKRSRTPLRQAAAQGLTEIVDTLLQMIQSAEDVDRSAMVNKADSFKGRTALHLAALHGHIDCVRALIQDGALVNIKDTKGQTALQLCCGEWALFNQSNYEDVICLLIDRDPTAATQDVELMAIAATNGSRRILEKLHGLQADLNRPDRYGWTPLMLAKQFKRADARDFLSHQNTWRSTLPSRWISPPSGLNLSQDGLTVVHTSGARLCISADKPIPPGLEKYYFEVTSKHMENVKQFECPEMAVGLCTFGASAINFPGWEPSARAPSARSWAYHGDVGGFGDSVGFEQDKDLRYRPGDTIGCGVDLETDIMFFTLNGRKLAREFRDVRGRLIPLLGVVDKLEVETNFGAKPFMWMEGQTHGGEDNADASGGVLAGAMASMRIDD